MQPTHLDLYSISDLSRSYSIYYNGVLSPSGGTSAASPVVASIIALLNDARLRAGRPTLGFLNPLIYAYAYQGFTDITAGQSDGCNGNDTQTGAPVPGVSTPCLVWRHTQIFHADYLNRLVLFQEHTSTLPLDGILSPGLVCPTSANSCSW